MSQFFTSGGQSIEASASASVLPMNIQGRIPLGWTGWISLQSKGLSRLFSSTSLKASVLWCSAFFIIQLSHPYMSTGKTIALTRRTFVGQVMSLSMGFSRQEHWSVLPFPSPGDCHHPWVEPGSPALQADSLPLSLHESPVGAQCVLVPPGIELVTKVGQDGSLGSQSQDLSGVGLFSLQSGTSPSQTGLPCTGV